MVNKIKWAVFVCTMLGMSHAWSDASHASGAKSNLVYGETGRLDGFDPYTVHEASGKRLADLIFDGLIEISPGGKYTAALAKSWKVLEGGTAVRFQLRDDVFWHGGDRKLSADDIVTTVRVLTAQKSEIPNKARFQVLSHAVKHSSNSVTIRLRRAMVDPLRSMMFKVLPHSELGNVTALLRSSGFAKKPIGTGPYRFMKANSQGEILLEAHDKYFKGTPAIGSIVMKAYADQNVMAQSLMFNSLDLVTYVSPRDLGEVLGDAKLSIVPYDALSFSFFAMNMRRPALKDKRVRQAISMAVNRQEMLDAFFQGKGRLISGPFPPTSWAYNLDVKPVPYDLKRAKALFEAAGLKDSDGDGILESKNGKNIELKFAVPLTGESEMIKRIVLAFQGFLGQAGLKVELQFMDWLVWKKKVLGEHDYDVTIASWSFDDASNITSLFHSGSTKAWGNNFVGYASDEVDALLTAAGATNDFDKKRAISHKLHAVLADDAPYVFLWTLKHHAAHNVNVTGVRVEPFSFFKHIANWSIGGAKKM